MEHEKFVHWLKGFLEANDSNKMDKKKVDIIKSKLDEVLGIKKEAKPSKRVKITSGVTKRAGLIHYC